MTTVKFFRSAIPCALLLGALFLGGCSQDDDWNGGGTGDAVSFTAGIEAVTRTTTGGDAWLTTDKMGIYMLTTGGSLTTSANVLADNRQYNVSTAGASSALTPDNGTPIYYPQTGNVDFISYYPYGTVTSGVYNITVVGQTSETAQNALDVLYAKTTNVAKSGMAVGLTFGHVLSKVTLNVTLGDGLTSLSGADITAAVFSGMPQTATLALQDGTLTAGVAGDFSALKAATTNAPAAATFTVLLVPQTSGTNRTAVFTVDGADYTWTISDTETFAAGNHYTYPVTVKLSGVTVGTPTITDWTVDATHDPGTASEIGAGIAKVKIPAGTFNMGSLADEPNSYADERPQYQVNIGEFWLSKYEITNAQYAAFLNAAGIGTPATANVGSYDSQTLVSSHTWGITHDGSAWKAQTGYENHPVIMVTWYGATAFAEWVGGRLPTEAEWEYACRAGTTTPFGIGDGTKLTGDMANINGRYIYELPDGHKDLGNGNGTYLGHTTAVGTYPYANGYGLYDMHGNVMEWTDSYWTDSYSETDRQNPNTSNRVLRGGFWNFSAQGCRSADRIHAHPDFAYSSVGFRVAFVP